MRGRGRDERAREREKEMRETLTTVQLLNGGCRGCAVGNVFDLVISKSRSAAEREVNSLGSDKLFICGIAGSNNAVLGIEWHFHRQRAGWTE